MVTQRKLTDIELADICEAAHKDWTQAVVTTFATFGVDLTDPDGPRISPADYAIPETQWGAIADACKGDGGSLSMAGHMLDWMNYGPSAY